jgi:hypothetical protein
MDPYYPQGAFVILDHDPYGKHDSRPAVILSDDKHSDRYETCPFIMIDKCY